MIQILKKVKEPVWYTFCPFCNARITYVYVSTVYCKNCTEELLPLYLLGTHDHSTKQHYKIKYHFTKEF